ncbi:hypothetical protein [Caballeronia sp. GAFFF1]|nr:hypothetical protein [Caballeronia sp. GAFFF1]
MFDNTSLEQFSMLDDFAPTAPVWRPFVQPASTDALQAAQECGEYAALS